MTLVAGIDGGQSSTVAVLGDERGALGRGVGPPADLVGRPRDPALQVAAIAAALAAARAAARIGADVRIEALVAGLSGFDRGESREPDLTAIATRTAVVHDSEIAHAGALAGGPGIVVIAGTGSVALGNVEPGGTFVRAGGWGYFFGDEGSAVWIARSALRVAMAHEDADATCELRERAFAFFGTMTLRSIQHAVAHGDVGRPALAAFASDVLAAASAGDPDAVGVRNAAVRALADLVDTVRRRLGASAHEGAEVSYAGGLFASADFTSAFASAVATAVPQAAVLAPRADPAGGALVLARALARTGATA